MEKHLILLKIQYKMGINGVLHQWFKTSCSYIKNENILNKELAEELHKPLLRKIKKRKVQSPFINSIWGADLAHMQ